MSDLTHTLGILAQDPPESLRTDVLLAVDLADRLTHRHVPSLGEDIAVTYNGHGISSVEFADRAGIDELTAILARPVVPDDDMPRTLASRLDRALGEGRLGSLPLDMRGVSEFRRRALEKAAEIPPGEVRPYGWIAHELGSPGAVRAVGSAMATNRIPILLPCHRVVPSDGSLGNYGGGSERKRALLAGEGLDVDVLEHHAATGVRVVGSDTTNVYCHPSCHAARRITERHRVPFRSAADARAAGLRPCLRCRPH